MKHINIAELLKDCPTGMELDCTTWDDVTLVHVDNEDIPFPITLCRKKDGSESYFVTTKYGQYYSDSKCVIFPKGKTTWEGFVPPVQFKEFNDGDIVATTDGLWVGITTGGTSGRLMSTYCVLKSSSKLETYLDSDRQWQFNRLATEEEKAKLFKAIKNNSYKWNSNTKTLEKLITPKFKVGDRIRHIVGREEFATVVSVEELHYNLNSKVGTTSFSISLQREWELVPNKFDITTLIPFESRVLVRAADNQFWRPAIWGVKQKDWDFYCVVGGEMWEQCIPYEGNEHLLGTIDDCDDYYKTW